MKHVDFKLACFV